MATVLGLAMKITADASGLPKSLSPVDRALQQLGQQAQSVTGLFDQFAKSSSAAADAQKQTATDIGFLTSALKTGQITAKQFAAEYTTLAEQAKATAEAFAEGARLTAANQTEEEKRSKELQRLSELLRLGAISQVTYNRAAAEASGANKAAAEAERQRAEALKARADLEAEGARVTAANLTQDERQAKELERLGKLLREGVISWETYFRAKAEASGANKAAADAEKAAAEAQQQAAAAAQKAANEAEQITRRYQTETEKRAATIADLDEKLKAGLISEETYRRAIDDTTGVTKAAADAEKARNDLLKQAQDTTAKYATEEEKRAEELDRVKKLLDQGLVTEQTYARALAEANGEKKKTEEAERARAKALSDAAAIIKSVITPQEKYDETVTNLRQHLEAGRLSQEQYNRALEKAQADLDKAGKEANKTDKNIEKLSKNVSLLAKIEVGRLLIDGFRALGNAFTSVTSQITNVVGSVNSSIDTLNDFSNRTGIGVEALQGYSLAAKMAGVDTEAFGTAVQKLGVNIGKATPGDKLDKSLKGINLSVAELRSLSPEEQFGRIGEAISQLPTAADRAAAAVEVFGKQGAVLAPLFKEGAAGIDELRDRAERLGVIVPESLVENVANMNDNFDLVRATVDGIIGQVIGQLAPAVTDVTDQFLKFVEEWSGAQGQGGGGIANAITDTLLQGAEVFAGLFDKAMAQFEGFGSALATTGQVFSVVGNTLTAITETLRTIFNVFEISGNVISMALGKFLEAIGGWISDDLEAFGRSLVDEADKAAQKNIADLESAAANAANAAGAVVGLGEDPAAAQARGAGAAESYVRGFRESVERQRAPEVRVEANIEKTRERFDNFFKGIVDQESVITDAMREFEAATLAVVDPMNMTADEIKRIEDAQGKVNQLIDQEIGMRQQAADAAEQQAEADGKKIDELLKKSEKASEIENNLLVVQREQARVAAELAATRGDSAIDAADRADAAVARLAELDQLQAKLLDDQQAAEQGFGEGFLKAFEAGGNAVQDAIVKAQEFGNAGAEAAKQFADAIAAAQDQARDGILNKEAFDREVERQKRLFDQRIELEKKAADARKKNEEEVDALLLANRLGNDNDRVQAFQNLQAVQENIKRTEEEIAAARKAGDNEAIAKLQERLKGLDGVQKREQDIASGQAKAREEALKKQEEQQKAIAKAQEEYAKEQQKIFEEQQKAIEAENERQAERLQKLNTPGQRNVNTADVRTSEGAALVLNLAAEAQDPAMIEARLQTKLLQAIAQGITGAAANYFKSPVAIVGYSSFGNAVP